MAAGRSVEGRCRPGRRHLGLRSSSSRVRSPLAGRSQTLSVFPRSQTTLFLKISLFLPQTCSPESLVPLSPRAWGPSHLHPLVLRPRHPLGVQPRLPALRAGRPPAPLPAMSFLSSLRASLLKTAAAPQRLQRAPRVWGEAHAGDPAWSRLPPVCLL